MLLSSVYNVLHTKHEAFHAFCMFMFHVFSFEKNAFAKYTSGNTVLSKRIVDQNQNKIDSHLEPRCFSSLLSIMNKKIKV